MSTTSQINQTTFEEAFSPVLEAGKDILYLAFSSGLSGTYHSACLAAEELAEKYPERTVRVIDTLQASMGEGLAVYYAATLKNEGKSLAEVADWFEANKMRVCAWFTVDDLMFLKRGGRLAAAPLWWAPCWASSRCCMWTTTATSSPWRRCAAAAPAWTVW